MPIIGSFGAGSGRGFGRGGSKNELIAATGGTENTVGDYKIHEFTSPGTLTVTAGAGQLGLADYLVIAGGGGGSGHGGHGRGAGGGGFRNSYNADVSGTYPTNPLVSSESLPLVAGSYPIQVGGGGNGQAHPSPPTQGTPSILSTITSAGGGVGDGGSGGGAYYSGGGQGSGNVPPVSPPQGNPGGTQNTGGNHYGTAGGGGAGGTGGAGSPGSGGTGGLGLGSAIRGTTAQTYTGGGGGSTFGGGSPGIAYDGGGPGVATDGSPAPANRGGGGGGGGVSGGNGGSGIVYVRYKYQ